MSEEKYDELALRALQAAIRNQDAVDEACQKLINTTENIEKKSNQLVNQINNEFENTISIAANKVINNLINKFESADRYADRATARYKSVSFWNPIVFYLSAITIGVAGLIGMTKIMLNMIPTQAEISERIEIMKQIDSSISENQIKLNFCDNRRCVQVNKDTSDKKFVGENGEVYLILDGY